MSDVTVKDPHQRDQIFRSRALTALAIQILTGCASDEAAAGVIDSFDDQGVDGIAVAPDGRRVWFVQTKWSDQGSASLDQSGALKLIRGIRKLQDNEYDDFGSNLDRVRDPLDDAMQTTGVEFTVVVCLLGKQPLAPVIRADLDKFVDEQSSGFAPATDLVEILFDQVYDVVRRGVADEPVALTATLEHWGPLPEPYQAYYGCVSAAEVADWYAAANERLFGKNLRRSLGLTEVNQQIRSSLRETPESFWYFNNGITVLCETIEMPFKGSTRSIKQFHLGGASVVNGAQTVRSIYEVSRDHPEAVEAAKVWVRLISLQDCPADFANRVTEATNTQNQVVARDFVALDPVQTELRDDFALSLQKAYVTKRGEGATSLNAGCSVEEVARALACAHPDAAFAARAKREKGAVLWERGRKGTYDELFRRSPGAERAWRLVTFQRAVEEQLSAEEKRREGRALRVATQAGLLITHVLLQLHGSAQDEPSPDDRPPLLDRIALLVDVLVVTIDKQYGPHSLVSSVLEDADRCVELAAVALDHLTRGAAAPELPLEYQSAVRRAKRSRKPNVVTVLVDATAIPDGLPLTFEPRTAKERASFAAWLTADPRRRRATWVNNRAKPLLWEADGSRHSPTGLAMAMIREVGVTAKAVQGPLYWRLPDGRSLVDAAGEIQNGEQGEAE